MTGLTRTLNLFATTGDIVGLLVASEVVTKLAYCWLAEGAGFDGPGLGFADEASNIPFPTEDAGYIEVYGVPESVQLCAKERRMANGRLRYTLDPADVGDCIVIQKNGLAGPDRMVVSSRLFLHGKDAILQNFMKAGEKHARKFGVVPFFAGKAVPATFVLPEARVLAGKGWRLNSSVSLQEKSDLKLT
jgi:hypothetical protein